MQIKSDVLFFQFCEDDISLKYPLSNMVNEPFDNDRFLPIKHFDDNLRWVAISVWDNERMLLHGPYQLTEPKVLVIENYKWAGDELYVYFEEGSEHDCSISGLRTGKPNFSSC